MHFPLNNTHLLSCCPSLPTLILLCGFDNDKIATDSTLWSNETSDMGGFLLKLWLVRISRMHTPVLTHQKHYTEFHPETYFWQTLNRSFHSREPARSTHGLVLTHIPQVVCSWCMSAVTRSTLIQLIGLQTTIFHYQLFFYVNLYFLLYYINCIPKLIRSSSNY